MAQQAVVKSIDEGIVTAVRSHLLRTIVGAAEQRLVLAPVSGDFKSGASVVIPATVSIDVTDAPEALETCVVTDDEGNVISDAFQYCEWSSADEDVFTVDKNGIITPVGAGEVVLTVAALGQTDTCTVTITEEEE